MAKKLGQLTREQVELPKKVQEAVFLRSQGLTWSKCAERVGLTTSNLRNWAHHPDFDSFYQECINENMAEAHGLLSDAAPDLARRLIQLALDPKVKGYTAVQSISESFRILQTGVIEAENRKQMRKIKDSLESLESGASPVIDV